MMYRLSLKNDMPLRDKAHPTDHLCLFSGNRLMKKGIMMTEPNEYISVTRKNFLSDDNKGRMTEKSFFEIQGTFVMKMRDSTFNGIIGENAFKHINNFLEVVGLLKVKGISQDRFRINVFPISLTGAAKMEADEDDDPDDIAEIFMIEGNLFDYETPLCKAFNDFNYLLEIDTGLFTFDIQGIKTYEEYELHNNMTGDIEEPWSDNVLKVEALIQKAKVEESWGVATPSMIKFCTWLKSSFENFHQQDHDVLVKLEECWWKVNAHEIAPFTRWENYGQGPYANIKTEKTYEPYLDINHIFGRNYEANNVGDTQGCQERKEEHNKHTKSSKPAHDSSICQVRRFEMIKSSFDADDDKEDTAYQRLDFTRKRAYSIPNTAYPTAYIRRGHRDHLLATLAHMLYCIVAKEQYHLAYFFVKRIECARATPIANLPCGMFLTRLYRQIMEHYPYVDNGIYNVVDRVMRPLALKQTRNPQSDRGIPKARHSVSSSSGHNLGSSSHHDKDDKDEGTSRTSTPSPSTYLNSFRSLNYQRYDIPTSSQQDDDLLFERQTNMHNQMQQIHEEVRGGFKSFGKPLQGVL
uniref:Ribosomal protein L7Ae/L30e/S12e/Gadd45 n=1 Tax=Tanacetum cinerariifolium TaxID=118510 RepID=A0A6L2LIH1_TANCI|nr:ribosomal protein L7Ae/L30e/S12e/Gadd45 [Tanacetum cinerariifolium]